MNFGPILLFLPNYFNSRYFRTECGLLIKSHAQFSHFLGVYGNKELDLVTP